MAFSIYFLISQIYTKNCWQKQLLNHWFEFFVVAKIMRKGLADIYRYICMYVCMYVYVYIKIYLYLWYIPRKQ